MGQPLLEVDNLTVKYHTDNEPVVAASDVSFKIEEGQFLGLAGESGCGKTTLAKAIFRGLDDNGFVASGKVRYKGQEIQDFSSSEINKKIRWDKIAWIPQGSMTSIDPLMKIKEQALQIGRVHSNLSDKEILDRFIDIIEFMGLSTETIEDYPHQLSGGMHQRVVIAMSLFLEPSLIIADEPTTALDVVMQDQVLSYFDQMREDNTTSMMLITHDISLIFETCNRMAIMHAGQLCEQGSVTDIFQSPTHPYSILLQDAFPSIHGDDELINIDGHPPELTGEVDFCSFKERCPMAAEECGKQSPPQELVDENKETSVEHKVSCVRKGETHQLRDGKINPASGSSRELD